MLRVARRSFARKALVFPTKKRAAPPAAPAPKAELSWSGAVLVAVGGGSLFGVGMGVAWVSSASAAPSEAVVAHPRCSCQCRVATFDGLSGSYDGTVGRDEIVMGVPLLRRWLLWSASGACLEVAAGTGANLDKYPAAATSVTVSDASEDMLRVAAAKVPAGPAGDRFVIRNSRVEDVRGAYDTVVDTFGLCSVDDPVAALVAIQRATRRDGKILLLEHGRGHYDWLNRLLDRYAARHLERWGCSWNRDYEAVMAEAGLRVETLRRFHFGTTFMVVAKPDPTLAAPPPDADSTTP